MHNDNRWYLVLGIGISLIAAYVLRLLKNRFEKEPSDDSEITISYYASLLFAIIFTISFLLSLLKD